MRRTRPTLLLALAGLAAAPPAHAHFNLMKPQSWANQDPDGNPQKSPPCGNENAVETRAVNEYKVGDTIDITIRETTAHPGHYRVFLASDQASLPGDPDAEVVPGTTDCGSLAIKTNPTLPLLADGLLVHTRAFSGPQTVKVALPAGMLCDHCVLQVVEFMAEHGAPCFYHHCANIKITATGADAGVPGPGPDGGVDVNEPAGGCCSAHGNSSSVVLALIVGALVLRRRARR
ncbi:MAG TPA: SCE4755 family polysaccharide monooxygenase-like protein [Kofleriaceae bacterium]|nr:SCE4755 family polysaccharide monooxygenase-like protein [Kofleriaceae bacterium]